MPDNHPYFNSGMMLLNLKKYREDNMAEKVLQWGKTHPDRVRFADQCMFNGVFEGNVEYLPFKWNLLERFRLEPGQSPAIIHFAASKPWNPGCLHERKKIYWKYAAQTPFYRQVRDEYYRMWLKPKLVFNAFRRWAFRWRFSRNRKYFRLFGLTLFDWCFYDDRGMVCPDTAPTPQARGI